MPKSDCEHIKEQIPLYIDHLLSEEQHDIVREHIASCAACKQEYDFFKAILDSAKELPQIAVSEHFHESVIAKMKTEGKAVPQYSRMHTFRRAVAGVCAAAAVVAVSVVSFVNLEEHQGGVNPDTFVTIPVETAPTEAPVAETEAEPLKTTAVPANASKTNEQGLKQKRTARPQQKTAQPANQTAETTPAEQPQKTSSPDVTEPQDRGVATAHLDEELPETAAPRGGGSSRAVSKPLIYHVTVETSVLAEAEALLSGYPKNEIGYKVDTDAQPLLDKLSAFSGYTVATEQSAEEGIYITLQ